MEIKYISSFNDPSIPPFHSLQDRTWAKRHGLFVVEGEFLLHRLLNSSFRAFAILMEEKHVEKLSDSIPSDVQVFVCSKKLISQIAGFDFHRGVIALGKRQSFPSIRDYIFTGTDSSLFVICPEINDVENLGVMIRNAAAFGAHALLLGQSCCDPFARRALRTSMGAAFLLPLYLSHDLEHDLQWLREQRDFQFYATTLHESAVPLHHMQRPFRLGILFGNEARGLNSSWIPFCDASVTIPMRTGVDSLNVGVASGIVLHYFTHEKHWRE